MTNSTLVYITLHSIGITNDSFGFRVKLIIDQKLISAIDINRKTVKTKKSEIYIFFDESNLTKSSKMGTKTAKLEVKVRDPRTILCDRRWYRTGMTGNP